MIIVDTNVVSEPMRPNGDPAVLAWLDRQTADTLFIATTSLAELLTGIETLPAGKRKTALGASLVQVLTELFGPRVLSFDRDAAAAYATIVGLTRAAGVTLGFADGQIAAIAKTHGFMVATLDTAPFTAAGLPVIDPWTA